MKPIVDAETAAVIRAQITAARDGNVMDRIIALERVIEILLGAQIITGTGTFTSQGSSIETKGGR